jgi:hypothetical protein
MPHTWTHLRCLLCPVMYWSGTRAGTRLLTRDCGTLDKDQLHCCIQLRLVHAVAITEESVDAAKADRIARQTGSIQSKNEFRYQRATSQWFWDTHSSQFRKAHLNVESQFSFLLRTPRNSIARCTAGRGEHRIAVLKADNEIKFLVGQRRH